MRAEVEEVKEIKEPKERRGAGRCRCDLVLNSGDGMMRRDAITQG